MSKRLRVAGTVRGGTVEKSRSRPQSNPQPKTLPLKPRRGLFIALCVIFVIWVAALIVMYFTTVYPQRHH